jgi:UDP:flavonoid glycosyltransferase YjiC (YdhE family)
VTPARRFLIVSWDGGGNTPPAFNLGARLVRRGHRVRMLGWDSMAARAADAGIEFATFRSMIPWPASLRMDDALDRLEDLLLCDGTRDDVIAESESFAPDVLVVDCMMGAALTAARQLRLPTAVIVHVLYSAFVDGRFDGLMNGSVRELLARTDSVLAVIPRGLDAPVELPGNTVYTGPIAHPDFGRQSLPPTDLEVIARPGDPWVLLSLSTTLQGQTEALPAMLEAVGSLPVRILLTLGGVINSEAVVAPPNVTVRDFLPHDAVLPHMAAVICHGGLSTITAALAAGVPIVCIPQGRDQHGNAARVAASGVGRVIDPSASAAEIATEVDALLRDDSARAAARRLAAEIAALGRGGRATDEVERLMPQAIEAVVSRTDVQRS